jgi:hypothetical protein
MVRGISAVRGILIFWLLAGINSLVGVFHRGV